MRSERLSAPHIHHGESAATMLLDVVLALLVLYAICYYYYGPRVVALGLAGMLSAVVVEAVCALLSRRRYHPLRDLSPAVTGLILPLLMPASIELYVPALAALFAIAAAKAPFGGSGHNVFNPAAAGLAFAAVCFPARMFAYPPPLTALPIWSASGAAALPSAAFSLSVGGIPRYDLVEMLLGNHPGPMGATNILVILACLLYLIFRGALRWETPVFFLLTAALLAFWFPRAPLDGASSMMYEMMSGTLLFGGVFMLGDPVTSPRRDWAKIAWAMLAACAVMLFRHLGGGEGVFVFVLLLMNAAVWGVDMTAERVAGLIRRRKLEAYNSAEIQEKS